MTARHASPSGEGPTARFVATRAVWAIALLAPGIAAFQPTFGGGLWGLLPGLVGAGLGVAIGGFAAWRAWTLLPTVVSVIGAYFLLGGAVALRSTTIAGVVPTMETLSSLTALLVRSWRDLLTVATPAGDFTGPMVVPWLAGLVLGSITISVMTRLSLPRLALLAPVVWLVVGIAFGVRDTPAALATGVTFAVVSLAWLVWGQLAATRDANSELLANPRSQTGPLLRRGAMASMVVLLASTLGYVAVAATSERANRIVLRDYVAPPLNLADYPTPLAKFRLYQLDLKDETLMTVGGLPADTRLRVATMDTYDGTVYNVSRVTADYVRVGRQIGGQPELGNPAEVEVVIGAYNDVWLPLAGTTHRVQFESDDARRQADGLYFNRATDSSLTTARLREGDVLQLAITGRPEISSADDVASEQLGASQLDIPQAVGVPEVLGGYASDAITGQGSAFQQLAALETTLREGYYSDGSDGLSRSGHTNERLTSMFTAESLIGDDEQYATAMALMAHQLNVPTRVVLGFDPGEAYTPGTEWEVRGEDARVWVESHFDGIGWVRFEPTPDRDRTPQTQAPKPKPQPRPMVEPPPNPPEQPAVEPNLATDGVEEDSGDEGESSVLRYLLIALGVLGALAALFTPFVLILLTKARRRRSRRTREAVRARFSGGWEEVLDAARDLGHPLGPSLTRRESAQALGLVFTDVPLDRLADDLDAGTFAPELPGEQVAEQAWERVEASVAAMVAAVPLHRRVRARLSLRSIRHRRRLEPRRGVWSHISGDRRGLPALAHPLARTSPRKKVPS